MTGSHVIVWQHKPEEGLQSWKSFCPLEIKHAWWMPIQSQSGQWWWKEVLLSDCIWKCTKGMSLNPVAKAIFIILHAMTHIENSHRELIHNWKLEQRIVYGEGHSVWCNSGRNKQVGTNRRRLINQQCHITESPNLAKPPKLEDVNYQDDLQVGDVVQDCPSLKMNSMDFNEMIINAMEKERKWLGKH